MRVAPKALLIIIRFVILTFRLPYILLHCHTLFDNKGKAIFCSFKIFQIFLPQNPAYFVSKKLTYADKKRHPTALQRGGELLHVNGITYLEADLKLNHLRILMAIISQLQRAIRLRLTRGNERKGIPEVFLPPKNEQGLRVLTIPVSAFHLGASNGQRLRECLEELSRIGIRFPDSGLADEHRGLIAGYDFTAYGRSVSVLLRPEMISRLLLVEEGYTSYSYASALSLSNKYTVRLYWLVCSWRNRGGFVLNVEEFRRMMSLGKAYERIDNIVTHILKPSSAELKARFPIWFIYRVVERGERRYICFKIGYVMDEAAKAKAVQEGWEFCRSLMSAAGGHVQAIADIWAGVDFEDLRSFMDKLSSVTAEIRIRRNINNVDAYVHAAMSVWQSDWLLRYSEL